MADFIVTPCGCPGCTSDPCNPTPAAPSPTLKCDSTSASGSKCGLTEFGTPSSPPVYYLTLTQSGTRLRGSLLGDHTEDQWSGSVNYNRYPDCDVASDTRQVEVTETDSSIGCTDFETYTGDAGRLDASNILPPTSNGCLLIGVVDPCQDDRDPNGNEDCADCETIFSKTVLVYDFAGCGGGDIPVFGVRATLSNEYDVSMLRSDVAATIPGYPGTFTGTCSALYDLSSDQVTVTLRRFKYKFQLPDLTGLTCYKITWLEGSAPMSYLWNGTDTETPTYEVLEPSSPGTVGISSIVASCDCS
jgi:hypothetical protein